MEPTESLKRDAQAIWEAGVAAVNAQKLTENALNVCGEQLNIGPVSLNRTSINRIVVLGGGKASGWMARGLLNALGENHLDQIVTGWVNVPDAEVINCDPIKIFGARPAGKNLPTEAVLLGTQKIIELANGLDERDLCICLISGGGSALLEKPIEPVTIAEIRAFTELCSSTGSIDIKQLNTVRKKLSHIKGGGLAIAAYPAQVISLILSDIIGDPIALIASGPTVQDDESIEDAISILSQLNQHQQDLSPILDFLEASKTCFSKQPWPEPFEVNNHIIGNNEMAVVAAEKFANELGYDTRVTFADLHDSRTAAEVGRDLAEQVIEIGTAGNRVCLISGGEPTVDLCSDPGLGGRNQQLVLTVLDELASRRSNMLDGIRFCVLSGGTDGEDGNVSVAGAMIDNLTLSKIIERDLLNSARNALKNNNVFPFLRDVDCTLQVESTQTNVCDLRIVLVSPL